MPGLKETELRAIATCARCKRKIGETGIPLFYIVTMERHGVKLDAIQRQSGLESLIGSTRIAGALGADEDMTACVMRPRRVMICEQCSTEPVYVCELAAEACAE